MENLWNPITIKERVVKNRLVMAPMTRSRAKENGVPSKLMSKYYQQRASMGLIITEGIQPSAVGQGYLYTPGIYTDEQIIGWQEITNAVHQQEGTIFFQLMHVGRISHPDNVKGLQAQAPSAIAPTEEIFTGNGMQAIPVPLEMTKDDIKMTVDDFRLAAKNAIQAGADGVEIHSANGYLLHQFLGENSNIRTDEYGGSIKNRVRFVLEVAEAVAAEIGADKTGIRISPMNQLGGVDEGSSGKQLYSYLVSELAKLDLAYLHMMYVSHDDSLLKDIRTAWPNVLIINRPSRPVDQIDFDIVNGNAEMVSVGMLALANPDLVERLKTDKPLNQPHPETFYGSEGEVGYTDYPFL